MRHLVAHRRHGRGLDRAAIEPNLTAQAAH
jgi:hypothetical protein